MQTVTGRVGSKIYDVSGIIGENKCLITADINSVAHKMVVDSGASVCVMDVHFYSDYLSHLPLNKSEEIYVKGVSDKQARIVGSIQLTFKLGPCTYHHKFLVLPSCPCSIILGTD